MLLMTIPRCRNEKSPSPYFFSPTPDAPHLVIKPVPAGIGTGGGPPPAQQNTAAPPAGPVMNLRMYLTQNNQQPAMGWPNLYGFNLFSAPPPFGLLQGQHPQMMYSGYTPPAMMTTLNTDTTPQLGSAPVAQDVPAQPTAGSSRRHEGMAPQSSPAAGPSRELNPPPTAPQSWQDPSPHREYWQRDEEDDYDDYSSHRKGKQWASAWDLKQQRDDEIPHRHWEEERETELARQ
ncbi:hypothetical protein ARMGADRAFT_1032711 [Armillaria gallica]|uniref:Uncharacterized protein n=1 Tax=Armillaria gallica TaxID=47427 RepID=A0A2H3D4E3_ARMGA|nr:hypothetical protein ARMGADRAFT_1032711 [Armillaria gallica]